jgi:hypothetical protein
MSSIITAIARTLIGDPRAAVAARRRIGRAHLAGALAIVAMVGVVATLDANMGWLAMLAMWALAAVLPGALATGRRLATRTLAIARAAAAIRRGIARAVASVAMAMNTLTTRAARRRTPTPPRLPAAGVAISPRIIPIPRTARA